MRVLLPVFLVLSVIPFAAANGDHGHTEALFDSGTIPPGETYELQMWKEGEFVYHCHPHPWMVATLRVRELDEGEDLRTFRVEIVDGSRYDNYSFQPELVELRVGDTVFWQNNGTMAHTVTSDDEAPAEKAKDSPGPGVAAAFIALAFVPLALRRRSR